MAEFVDGFENLSDIYPCVSIFGSARVAPGDESYETTVTIAKKLAENGFNIITGGGPGTATLYLVQYIYNNGFASAAKDYGIAASASVVMGLVLIVLTLIQLRLGRER